MMLSSRVLLRRVLATRTVPTYSHVAHTRSFAAVSMSLLKELRSKSGAPMVECKKALEASDTVAEAMDWLRENGAAKASSKLQGREAVEGLVGVVISDNAASIVQVNSETDFAGRSESFAGLVQHIAEATLQVEQTGEVDKDQLMSAKVNDKSVQNAMEEAIVAIRENLKIGSAIHCKTDENDGQWVGYVHARVTDTTGSSAAVVHVRGASDDVLQEVGKKLAMHVVAARPTYLNPEAVPEEALEKEKAILRAQMDDSGKPPEILEKIITGKMRKFYEGSCLTEQSHMVLEDNPKVSKALKEAGVEVTHFEVKAVG